jgi:RNA-directed DNA polymerase
MQTHCAGGGACAKASRSAPASRLYGAAALHRAWLAAARGKRGRPDVAAFERGWPDGLLSLSRALREGHWQPGGYRTFAFIERGKRRLISAAPFADRVVHHAITAAIEPLWEARFVPWSFANRRGRGTHAALFRAQDGAARHRWALKLDVQRFFPSADHAVLMALLARHVREQSLLDLLQKVVRSGDGILRSEWKPTLFPGDDLLALARPKGMPIGNQTSQFFANVYLHPLDLFIAHQLKPGIAARYVDDLLLFDNDRGRLHDARDRIDEKLAALRLKAHAGKTRLWDVRQGVPFVGYRIFPWGAKLPRETVTRFRRNLRDIAEDYADGALDLAGAKQRVSGLIGHARPARAEAVLAEALDDYPLVRGA